MRDRHLPKARGGGRRDGLAPLPDATPEQDLPLVQLARTVGNEAFSRFIRTRDDGHDETAGHPLDPATRGRMEGAFGQDFSGVVVHSDADAGAAARALNARAFALGNHIVFDPGEYVPGSVMGDLLIAHELAHVQQQAAGHAGSEAHLEGQANAAAARAVMSPGTAKAGIAGAARGVGSSIKAGLRPQRCPVSATRREAPAYFGTQSRATMDRLNDIAESGASLSNWIRFGSVIVAFEDPISALHAAEAQEALNAVPVIIRASMRQEVQFLILDDSSGHFLNDQERRFWNALESSL